MADQPFEREERFIVIKRKGLAPYKEDDIRELLSDHGVATVECVVVESDWPEYEIVWRLIEARASGHGLETCAALELAALTAKATDDYLTDDGRYFLESLHDLSRCRHGETGEYCDSDDGRLIEWLWNHRQQIQASLHCVAGLDDALLCRAERAWQRFFYPAADCFANRLGDKLPSIDLEVADCLRLVLAAVGCEVSAPKSNVPAPERHDSLSLVQARGLVDAIVEHCRGADFSCDMKAATKAVLKLVNVDMRYCRHAATGGPSASQRPDLQQWQADRSEYFDSTTLSIVAEYAEWRDSQDGRQANG